MSVQVTEINTGNNAELITQFPFNDDSLPRVVVFSIKLIQPAANDIILAMAEGQFHHLHSNNVMLGSDLLLCSSPSATNGSEITESNTFNMTDEELQKATTVKHGSIVLEQGSNEYINLINYASSDAFPKPLPPGTMFVDRDYGRLSALHFNPNPSVLGHYNSGNYSELVTNLFIGKTTAPVSVIYSVQLSNLQLVDGDILIALSEHELSNKTRHKGIEANVSCFSQIILAEFPCSTSGTEITESNGFWISPDMHHLTFAKNGTLKITEEVLSLNPGYVNLIASATSSIAYGTDYINVEQDYGNLIVLHIKANNEVYEWNTGNGSELVTQIPIQNPVVTKSVIYSQDLGSFQLQLGDIILVLSECQFTNQTGDVVSVFSQLILTTGTSQTSGLEITEDNGYYMSSNMQNGTSVKNGTITVTQDIISAGFNHINHVSHAGSTAAAGQSLIVQPDYGRLSVVVFRP